MIEVMMDEATVIEAKSKKDASEATTAAIGAAFSRGSVGRKYANLLQDVIDEVRNRRRIARGLPPTSGVNRDATEIRGWLGKGRRRKR